MKKLICLLLSVFILMGCQSQSVEKIQINGIETIEYEKLIQNLNSNVKFILYIGRPDCGDCEEFYPILEEYIKTRQGTGIYYLNIKEFRDQSRDENATQAEKDFYENLYKELHFDWTPTIHVISNGRFVKTYQYLDEEYYEITDQDKQTKRKQKFIDDFQIFMDEYFREEVQ